MNSLQASEHIGRSDKPRARYSGQRIEGGDSRRKDTVSRNQDVVSLRALPPYLLANYRPVAWLINPTAQGHLSAPGTVVK